MNTAKEQARRRRNRNLADDIREARREIMRAESYLGIVQAAAQSRLKQAQERLAALEALRDQGA